ncbi:hypothetical protein PV336_29375 [Streptomyces sp. MI02-2A]|uniref:hypothetical protein n=1 Tax=Streptomyces sp. MI02-2A TaxID=3028688 RepID=UPI0029A87820|nr:hypothetical protein [Streptomyces sp. MI02-2A]MDX3263270.1 hypothetical protein [Streptomyces sp. MI02-2A]
MAMKRSEISNAPSRLRRVRIPGTVLSLPPKAPLPPEETDQDDSEADPTAADAE